MEWGMGTRVEWTNMCLVLSNVKTPQAWIRRPKPGCVVKLSVVVFFKTFSHMAKSFHSRARSINRDARSERARDQEDALRSPRSTRNRAIFLFLSVGPSPLHLFSFLNAYSEPPISNIIVQSSSAREMTRTERRYPVGGRRLALGGGAEVLVATYNTLSTNLPVTILRSAAARGGGGELTFPVQPSNSLSSGSCSSNPGSWGIMSDSGVISME